MLGRRNKSLLGNGKLIEILMDAIPHTLMKYGEKNGSIKYKDKAIDDSLGHSMRTITAFAGHPNKSSILKCNREMIVWFVGFVSLGAVTNSVGNNGSLNKKLFKQDRDEKN